MGCAASSSRSRRRGAPSDGTTDGQRAAIPGKHTAKRHRTRKRRKRRRKFFIADKDKNMELQRTTAGTFAPPRTSGTEDVWSVLGRLIFCIAVPLPIQSKNRIVTHRRKISFIFHFCRPDASHIFHSSSTHCKHTRKRFQRTLKSKEQLLIFCAPASVPPKQCSTAHLSLKESAQKTPPHFREKTPFFPTPPPAFRPSPRTALR